MQACTQPTHTQAAKKAHAHTAGSAEKGSARGCSQESSLQAHYIRYYHCQEYIGRAGEQENGRSLRLTLCEVGRLACLVLRDFVHGVLPALCRCTECSSLLWYVDLHGQNSAHGTAAKPNSKTHKANENSHAKLNPHATIPKRANFARNHAKIIKQQANDHQKTRRAAHSTPLLQDRRFASRNLLGQSFGSDSSTPDIGNPPQKQSLDFCALSQ
jgi:hypothetical protein